MRRRAVQPEIRSFVLLLRSPVTPFDSANFMKNANCFEECNIFGYGKCELSVIQEGPEKEVQIFGKESANSSPILRCKFLARKSAKLFANFSATLVTSLPSLSVSLSLSLSLSPSAPHAQYRKRFL